MEGLFLQHVYIKYEILEIGEESIEDAMRYISPDIC